MATPKKRMSPVRSGNRRRNLGINLPSTTVCTKCGATVVRHQACPACGYYRTRATRTEVLTPTKSK